MHESSDSAVLEQSSEIKPPVYKMPLPQPDTTVRYYAFGDQANAPQVAYVKTVYPATNRIKVIVPSDQLAPVKTCMHISDPDVKKKPFAVKTESGGTWDFSTEHYRRMAWEEDMTTRFNELAEKVRDLEQQWNDPPSPYSKKKI